MIKKILTLLPVFCLFLSTGESIVSSKGNVEKRINNKKFRRSLDASDQFLSHKIRQVLVNDDSLSDQAKNVQIIILNGVITLRGTVNNEKEKDIIGKHAKGTTGVRSVDNQIEVMGNTSIFNAPSDIK